MGIESTDCTGRRCGYSVFKDSGGSQRRVDCSAGNGSCVAVQMLKAEPSDFHDQSLIDATNAIEEILAKIPKRDGRSLSFLHTNMGTLLSWVEHGAKVPYDAVTDESDDHAVTEALGLIVDSSYAAESV